MPGVATQQSSIFIRGGIVVRLEEWVPVGDECRQTLVMTHEPEGVFTLEVELPDFQRQLVGDLDEILREFPDDLADHFRRLFELTGLTEGDEQLVDHAGPGGYAVEFIG